MVNPKKLEPGFRLIGAGIPNMLPQGHEDTDVPTFRLLLRGFMVCFPPGIHK